MLFRSKVCQQMVRACNHGKVITIAWPRHIDVPHVVIIDELKIIFSVTKATDTFDVPPCKFEIGNEVCKHKLILS